MLCNEFAVKFANASLHYLVKSNPVSFRIIDNCQYISKADYMYMHFTIMYDLA